VLRAQVGADKQQRDIDVKAGTNTLPPF
jgi:hypothetical protein